MSPEVFYTTVRDRTAARFGHAVNPHPFRDCLATGLATEDPDRIRMAQFLLGHKAPQTAERYYIHAQTHRASQKVQLHIQELRRKADCDKGRADRRRPDREGASE
jgi:integrase